jgi:hypothetical protein
MVHSFEYQNFKHFYAGSHITESPFPHRTSFLYGKNVNIRYAIAMTFPASL